MTLAYAIKFYFLSPPPWGLKPFKPLCFHLCKGLYVSERLFLCNPWIMLAALFLEGQGFQMWFLGCGMA